MHIEGNGMKTCEQCGNPVPDAAYVCPYCQGHDMDVPRGALVVRRIDLGHVGLSVQEAREQLQDAIAVASFRGEDVLVVVHGYGSTGVGGHIRSIVRSEAKRATAERTVSGWTPGEQLRTGMAKDLVRRLPALSSIEAWQRENPGMTIIVVR